MIKSEAHLLSESSRVAQIESEKMFDALVATNVKRSMNSKRAAQPRAQHK
jgi:hypothetical protein